MSKRALQQASHGSADLARIPTVQQILTSGHDEMRVIRDDMIEQRRLLQERRALLANALQAIDGQIGILDDALRLIEANHGHG